MRRFLFSILLPTIAVAQVEQSRAIDKEFIEYSSQHQPGCVIGVWHHGGRSGEERPPRAVGGSHFASF